jgi:glycosyltransferase involved in cell wall biosynthesis
MGEFAPRSASVFAKNYKTGIAICIPAYNEEATIESVVLDAQAVLGEAARPGEILVIDDCSTDRTWEILCRLQNRLSILQLHRHTMNQGIASTFAELYQRASMELVFLNSADGQWKMSTLLELLPMADQYDIIIARRRVKHYGVSRHVVSWLFNILPMIFFATPTYDAGSVKLVRRGIYDIPIISTGVFSEAERIIRARRRGFRVGVKDVDHFPRRSGKALGASLSLTVEAMLDLLRCWFNIVILRRD